MSECCILMGTSEKVEFFPKVFSRGIRRNFAPGNTNQVPANKEMQNCLSKFNIVRMPLSDKIYILLQ